MKKLTRNHLRSLILREVRMLNKLQEQDTPSLEDQLEVAVHNAIGALEAAGFTVTVLDVRDGHAKVEIKMGVTDPGAGGVGVSSDEGQIVSPVWLMHGEIWQPGQD